MADDAASRWGGASGKIGAIAGALSAVGVPEHEATHYAEWFVAGDFIVVVDAGARAPEAARILGRATACSTRRTPRPRHSKA